MKQIAHIFGIVLITAIFSIIVMLVELPWLSANLPQLPEDVTIEQWKTSFSSWAVGGVGIAGVASLLWYGLAQWGFKINNPQNTRGKSLIWGLLFLFSIIGAIALGAIFTTQVKSGGGAVYLCFIVNGFLCYYVSTLLFSPAVFKYIPWGAAQIRFW